jgi:citrate lyase subunit beta / citryl-CoA lyase
VSRPTPPQTRSQLYVPGNRPTWFAKAIAAGADALILDLEDSVPIDSKVEAREAVSEFLRGVRDAGVPFLVRVNDADTPLFLDDVLAVVEAGATGLVLPKVSGPDDVIAADRLLLAVELRCARAPGSTLIVPILETPSAIRNAYRIGLSSRRVAYMGGMSARGGDIERGVAFRWSAGGEETFTFRAQALLDARAADVPHPVTGTWTDVDDLDGLRAFAVQSRNLGYEGMALIHPSHVAIANEVFSVDEDELERDRQLLDAMAQAERDGSAATRFDGHMVDVAMVTRARERLANAQRRDSSTAAGGMDG